MFAEQFKRIARSKRCACAAAVLLLLALPVPGRGLGKDAAVAGPPERGGFVITPVVGYTPETLLSWGIAGIHYFQLGRSHLPTRLSNYRFNLIQTQKKQTIAQVDYELYLTGDKVMINGQLKYALFPDRFYGIGNRSADANREDFNARNWRLQLSAQRRWGESIFTGLHVEVFSQTITQIANDSQLASGDIAGGRGINLVGAGMFGKWDSRDNTFSTAKGAYGAVSLNFFAKALGSDFAFTQLTLDGRKYFPLGRAAVLAVQGVFKTTWGECPFQTLSNFGGAYLLRGFYEGRYRDKSMLALQMEYRLPVWGRFGLSAFAGMAQVQPRPGLLALAGFHAAEGVGLRYKFNARENLNIRLDVGFAGSSPAFYLTFAEAF
jgi:hypothetical protein